MKWTVLLFLSPVLITTLLMGQENIQKNKKIFYSLGFSAPFCDFTVSPVQIAKYSETIQQYGSVPTTGSGTGYFRYTGNSITEISLGLRYNLIEMSENRAFGISAFPTIGLSYINVYSYMPTLPIETYSSGYGKADLPILIEYDFGTGSTASARENGGGFIGMGVDYVILPFYTQRFINNQNIPVIPKFSYYLFAIKAGCRYVNKRNRLNEVNLLLAFGSSNSLPANSIATELVGSTFNIRVSWIKILKI